MNWTKRSDTVRVAGATPLTTPHVRTNHGIRVFWENQFFWFLGVQKVFWDPQNQKIFSQKNKFCDLSEHGGWLREWPHPPWWYWTSWFNSLNPLPALGPYVYLIKSLLPTHTKFKFFWQQCPIIRFIFEAVCVSFSFPFYWFWTT